MRAGRVGQQLLAEAATAAEAEAEEVVVVRADSRDTGRMLAPRDEVGPGRVLGKSHACTPTITKKDCPSPFLEKGPESLEASVPRCGGAGKQKLP